jgi:hypothetical protein
MRGGGRGPPGAGLTLYIHQMMCELGYGGRIAMANAYSVSSGIRPSLSPYVSEGERYTLGRGVRVAGLHPQPAMVSAAN